VIWRVQGNRHSLRSASEIFKQARKNDALDAMTVLTDNPALEERTLDYLGVDTQYFSAVLIAGTVNAPRPFVCQQAYAMPVGPLPELKGTEVKTLNTTYRLVSTEETVEPGKTATHDYHIFLGPKAPALLQHYQLADIMEYGWFGWVAKPLSKVLHLFYLIVHNYGMAIILLTVLVRGAMFPIGRKAARNAQMMQELAPEIKKLKEKYKNDLEKQGQAQRELWKKHNFNPLGGCWLMFLQLPIFIGLYRCLSVDIELRQAAMFPGIQWSSNLAGPDMAWYWKGILPDFLASETGWLGPYLNIFPIITIVLFIVQQKMFTPPATDEQTRMQQNMMKYMMIFMGVMFFKVPAGLCVYFIASSLWGIGERKLLPPTTTKTPATVPKDTPKKPSLVERLMNRAPAETVDAIRARRKSRR
jgi:YidC/Oxa1 family membrane protein insertase